jgi:hypothetical protein
MLYSDVWRKEPLYGKDGHHVIKWHPCRFNKTSDTVLMQILNFPWDAKGFHRAYVDYEHIIFTAASQAVVYYSTGVTLIDKWWEAFSRACHYLAALRDYHDSRMGMKSISQTNSHIFDEMKDYDARHPGHFLRIHFCLVLPGEFRNMLENGSHAIPMSVYKLLIEVKNTPYVTESNLHESLIKINNKNQLRIKSHFSKSEGFIKEPSRKVKTIDPERGRISSPIFENK